MKLKAIVVCVVVFLAGQWVAAQKAPAEAGPEKKHKKAAAEPGGTKKDKGIGNPLPQKKFGDPIAEHLVGPEMLMKGGAKTIGLTVEQEAGIRREMQLASARFKELQQQLGQEVEALGTVLSPDQVDEKKAVEQLDKVLNLEREIKRTHLQLAVMIKNKLTPEQLAKVREIKAEQARKAAQKGKGPQAPASVQAKMEKLQAGLKQGKQEGRDLSALKPVLEELEPLLRDGRFQEAEMVIDRALGMLGENK